MDALTAAQLPALFERWHVRMAVEKEVLTALDGRLGDGDLGVNLELGYGAVAASMAVGVPDCLDAAFRQAGMAFNRAAPSTLGTLLSFSMLAGSAVLADTDVLDLDAWIAVTRAGLAEVMRRGKAALGDKTIVDAWTPYADALEAARTAGMRLAPACRQAATAARGAAERTRDMAARVGRAGMFGEQAIGHPDGGATAFAMLMETFADFVA